MKKQIFVLSGCQGSGKSTYAKWLQAYTGLENSKIMKFAEPLYELHDRCLPVLKLYGLRPYGMTKDGELLQVLGTEFGRNKLGENVWVNTLKKRVDKYLKESPTKFVIIDDCRFENEFNAFHADAHMIRLTAPASVRKARCTYWREDTSHPSETGLDDYERKMMFHAVVNTELATPKDAVRELLTQWGHLAKV